MHQARGLDMRPVAPAYAYAAVSLSNVVATTCQYEALKYLTFPLQTLAKCAKMIPVMLWGALILRKTYKPKVWAPSSMIAATSGSCQTSVSCQHLAPVAFSSVRMGGARTSCRARSGCGRVAGQTRLTTLRRTLMLIADSVLLSLICRHIRTLRSPCTLP